MGKTARIFLGLVLSAGLVSCASGPPQKESQTAPPPQAATAEPEQRASAHEPAPAQPAHQEQSLQAGPVEDSMPSPEAAPGGQQQTAEIPLGLPAAPQARSAPDVETVQTAEPSEAENFPLRVPEAPAAPAPGKTPAAAAQPPAERAPRPKAIASQPQSPAARSGTAASQPGAAAAQAAALQPSANTDPQAPAGATYGRLREIYARQGDDVQIGLDGEGFLFLGFPDRSPDGMSFKGKETKDGKTWFSFKALKLGTYDLDFLRQDNSTGTSSKETVRVHVVSDADFSAAVAQGQEPPQESSEPGDPAFAAKLSSLGQYNAAIAELLKGYRDGNPQLNDRIARLYLRTGAYDAAAKYYSKNLAAQGQLGDSAVLGLAEVAMAQKDQAEFLSLLKRLLAVKDPGLEETLLAAVRFEKDKHEVGIGIDLASEYLARYPDGKWTDEADYLLARLLEADSQFRDIARARAIYDDILARFPESPFAADARQRVEYIERHFIEIR